MADKLNRKFSYSKGRITAIANFIKDYNKNVNTEQEVHSRISELKKELGKFQTFVEDYAEILSDEEFQNLVPTFNEFEENYHHLNSQLLNLITVQEESKNNLKNADNINDYLVKLPEVNINIFDGNPLEWITFKQTFVALVHSNNTLSPIIKFTYLLNRLKGEAKNTIGHIILSNDGYKNAWESLCKRYDDTRLIVEKHIEALCNLNSIPANKVIELRSFLNECNSHVTSLQACNHDISGLSELFIVHLITRKLDIITRKQWEETLLKEKVESPTWNMIYQFLQERCKILQSVDNQTKNEISNKFKPKDTKNFMSSNLNVNNSGAINKNINCKLCKQEHLMFNCKEFLALSPKERYFKVKDLGLCINCFSGRHKTLQCHSHNCKICNSKHHSLLHRNIETNESGSSNNNNLENKDKTYSAKSECANSNIKDVINQSHVFLSTACVYIQNEHGKPVECRALLDSGSQSNFISQNLANLLKIPFAGNNKITVTGINSKGMDIHHSIKTIIKSKFSNYSKTLEFSIIPTISNALPQQNLDVSRWFSLPKHIKLADKYFFYSRPIDILIGAEIFFEIVTSNKIPLGTGLPILQETLLGWVISGKYESFSDSAQSFLAFAEENNLESYVHRFWEMESFPQTKHLSEEENKCEQMYNASFDRNADGRYIVKLPLNENISSIGESREQALQRFLYLEKRLSNNPEFKKLYVEFMDEYLNLKHMSAIKEQRCESMNYVYYLPHHGVLKPDSKTTKLRVVFDASAKSSSGISLNDAIMCGPTVQPSLIDIVLRFRTYKYAMSADIIKMYRQIQIAEEHRSLQRILWRSDPSDDVQEFELSTVTYGTKSAPYLATRTLIQLASDEKHRFPKAAQILCENFYVDDVLFGSDTLENALELKHEVIDLLSAGGFQLHKWNANASSLIEDLTMTNNSAEQTEIVHNDNFVKTLGLAWKPNTDTFIFIIPKIKDSKNFTKRSILADTARLFDPLGLLGPIILNAKLVIQDLWRLKLEWDDIVDDDIAKRWHSFIELLQEIKKLEIPRCVIQKSYSKIELHGYADASQKAYAACIYIRIFNIDGTISLNLLCCKTRVAPLKPLSLPRLELSAALLVSQLMVSTIEALHIKPHKVILWSDSTITLYWINTSPHKLKLFVANRVSQIQELTTNFIWCYVNTNKNPADLPSRGITTADITEISNWWSGPDYLLDKTFTPQSFIISPNDLKLNVNELECKKDIQCFKSQNMIVNDLNYLFERYSSYTKLLRIVAYIIRFLNNCKTQNRIKSELTQSELDNSLNLIVKIIQKDSFGNEIKNIQNRKDDYSSNIKQLAPFIDQNQILRVGGRLSKTQLEYNVKHPILLPHQHPFTDLIFRYYHLKNLHAGPSLLLSFVRQKFWVINGKSVAKRIVRKCIQCFKCKPSFSQQIMGDLPVERTTSPHAFNTTGLDLCGPFDIKIKMQRKSIISKIYVASFVCFATKAIHLEIVSDLSSDSFIAALKRFIFRRGIPNTLWSDNATNFHGSHNKLKEMYNTVFNNSNLAHIKTYCLENRINWKFIPPRTPHFGGLWESSVKSFKYHFKRVLSTNVPNYEEFNTLLINIEGILNSRPLTLLSTNANDPEPLTPGHFLIGHPITSIVEPSYLDSDDKYLRKWEKIWQLSESFWRRYSTEYIHTLQTRNKWINNEKNLDIGDVVLLNIENLQPTNWILGIIVNIFKGKDCKVRVVEIKTKFGLYKRPITKIAKLPLE